jgi:hypothetical protein
MTLRTGNSWFSGPQKYSLENAGPVIKLMVQQADRLPKMEHMKDYENFIYTLVERYDGDGKKDMPGLKKPVLHYQIGNEYGNPTFWTGSVKDYYKLYETAVKAARRANPVVKIIPNGLRTNDAFHNDPNASNLEETMKKYENQVTDSFYLKNWKRTQLLDEGSLILKGIIDIVDAGGNVSWHTTSEGYYNYVRSILDNAGNTHVPIWDMETRNEPLLITAPETHIYEELEIPNSKHLLNMLKMPNNPQHTKVQSWYRAEQSRLTAKVFVTKFAAGNEKVFMGMPMDWDKGLGALSWPNPFMGFLSSDTKPWPAYYTLKILVNTIDGFSSASKLQGPNGVALYRFDFNDGRKSVWIAWLEDKKPRGLNSSLPTKNVKLADVEATKAFEIPTSGRKTKPIQFNSKEGGISIKLSPTPVIITQ